ncbi:MAG: MFS transporter [Anaerolineae bacterium]|nr:MFS transporter [Anaerolineae bacterium]
MLRFIRTTAMPADVHARNIRHLYLEIGYASILGAIVSFTSAFAIRLGASNEMIALMTSIPAMVAAIFSIPSARFLETRKNRRHWMWGSLLLLRIGYGLIALLPIIIPHRLTAATWLILWVIALNLPAIFFTNGFQAALADIIPEKKRAFVLSRRSIIWSVGLVFMSALAGFWLDWFPGGFPGNYQLLYLIGFLTALGSNFYLNKIVFPEQIDPQATPKRGTAPLQPPAQATHTPMRITQPMRRLLVNSLIYQIGLTIAAPLFNVYYINRLAATDGWIGINSAAASVGVIIGYLMWERLLRKRSFSWGLRMATTFTWLFPVGIALFPDLTIIILLNFVVNMLHPGVDLSTFNTLYKLADPAHKAMAMSWYNTVINISAFAAPLVGAALANIPAIDIRGVLIMGGLFRIIGTILYRVNPVDVEATV